MFGSRRGSVHVCQVARKQRAMQAADFTAQAALNAEAVAKQAADEAAAAAAAAAQAAWAAQVALST